MTNHDSESAQASSKGGILPDIEAIEALLLAHQMVSTVTDACACGAGDLDTLEPSGTAIRKHIRHVALVIERAGRLGEHANCARRVESGDVHYSCGISVPGGIYDGGVYAEHVRRARG